MTSTDILILAGKKPRPGTVLAEVQERLETRGLRVSVDWQDPLAALATMQAALLVHRGLPPGMLTHLAQVLAASSGQPKLVNSPGSCLAALNRVQALDLLRKAFVPVPQSSVQSDWSEVCRLSASGPVFVKALSGSTGRAAGVMSLAQGAVVDPAFPGPWHVETAVTTDGYDRKLYAAGSRVFGLLKPWPRDTLRDTTKAQPFDPPASMIDMALAAGRATGLELFGVDLVGCDGEFAVVDINPFPGYRGVEGAADAVADHISSAVTKV